MSIVKLIEAMHDRLQRARELVASDGSKIIKVNGADAWVVPSQSKSNGGFYLVQDGKCSCPDAARPEIKGWCKHKLAIELLNEKEQASDKAANQQAAAKAQKPARKKSSTKAS